jgi:hypothetical protein
MVKYRETKACDVNLKLTAIISLRTLNRAHCQREILLILIFPLMLPFFWLQNIHPPLGAFLPVYLSFHSLSCFPVGYLRSSSQYKGCLHLQGLKSLVSFFTAPLSWMLSIGPDLLGEFSQLCTFFSPYHSTRYRVGGPRF